MFWNFQAITSHSLDSVVAFGSSSTGASVVPVGAAAALVRPAIEVVETSKRQKLKNTVQAPDSWTTVK